MPELKGSKTEKNLWEAYSGESQARTKYTLFASVAKKEGFEQIAAIFEETSLNEKEHAKLHFKALGQLGNTAANLKAAAGGEHYEWTEMYPRMAKEAREEGFEDLAKMFENIATVEKEHEKRYLTFLKNVEEGRVFKRDGKVFWHCRNCGAIIESTTAPKICPVCDHPQAHFELNPENY